jgi:tetratricopeptide (TPR) repeat protein
LLAAGGQEAGDGIGFLRAAAALRPESPGAWLSLGLALRDRGDKADAAAALQEAVRLDAACAPAQFFLGCLKWEAGDRPGAVTAFRAAVRRDPGVPGLAHFAIAGALRDEGDAAGAGLALQEAVRRAPRDLRFRLALAAELHGRGDTAGAEAAYREAVRIDPWSAPAHAGLGDVLMVRGDVPGAAAAFREAVRIDPAAATAHRNLGVMLWERGDAAGAETSLRTAIRLDPVDVAARVHLGDALRERRDFTGAEAAYRAAVRFDPKDERAYAGLAEVLLAKGETAGAAEVARAGERELRVIEPRLRRVLRLADHDRRLSLLLATLGVPESRAEAADLADLAMLPSRRRPQFAYRVYARLFAADPAAAAHTRTSAAAAAVQLAAGADPTAKIGLDEWFVLQKQARDWLTADLARLRPQAEFTTPSVRQQVRLTLARWRVEPDFAPVRDADQLSRFPDAAERAAWEALWNDVAAVLAKAGAPPTARKLVLPQPTDRKK